MDPVAQADAELRRNGLGHLAVLHDHLISYITFLLDLEDVVRLSCCSRILRVFACEEPLWLGLCLKLHDGVVEYKANWRQTALGMYTARAVPPAAVEAAARPLPPLTGLSSLFLYKRWYRCHVDLTSFLPPPGAATVDRVDAAAMSPAEFAQQYDKPGMPVLLGGLMGGCPAASWSLPQLSSSFPTSFFKVSKPHGGRALMTLPAYVDYMARQADEEPLYIFDATFAEAAPGIRELYDVPHVFTQDYYSVLMGSRPHYRWLVLGPARAGASWHVDPALTSAWNALLSGRKRWALYPPHVRPPGVDLEDDGEEAHTGDDGLTSLQWFLEVYPALPPHLRPIELVQNPGDVVFVPGGWWHCVLNLETSVAVTQNYVGDANLARVTRYMAAGSSAYHADPLAFHDPRVEVAAWAEKFPHLSAAAPPPPPANGAVELDSDKEAEREEEEKERAAAGEKQRQGRASRARRGQQQGRAGEAVAGRVEEREGRLLGVGRQRLSEGEGEEGAKAVKKARQEGGRPSAAAPVGCVARGLYSRSLAGTGGGGDEQRQMAGGGSGGDAGDGDGERPGANGCAAAAPAAANARSGGGVGAGGGGGGDPEVAVGRGVLWPGELEYVEVAVWRRERILGRWLRRLWLEQPATRPVIQDCLFGQLHGGFWREVLRVIARQQGGLFRIGGTAAVDSAGGGDSGDGCGCLPAEPTPLELIPLMGADALVFLFCGTAIKIFAHEVPAVRGLMCALEARAPQLLLPRTTETDPAADPAPAAKGAAAAANALAASTDGSADQAPPLPQPLAWGAVAAALTPRSRGPPDEASDEGAEEGAEGEEGEPKVNGGEEEAGRPPLPQQQPLLYVVQQQLQDSLVLQELLDQDPEPGLLREHLAAVAEALGDLLGAMHATAAATAAAAAAAGTFAACGSTAGTAALLPATAAASTAALSVEEWDQVVLGGIKSYAVWHDRYHNIWVSELGCLSSAPEAEAEDAADADRPGAAPRDAVAPPAAAAVADAATAAASDSAASGPSWTCDVAVVSVWWPFVQHLRWRQRQLLRGLPGSSLPAWVQDQLTVYLPQDPAQLLGFSPSAAAAAANGAAADVEAAAAPTGGPVHAAADVDACGCGGPGVPPLLLHGDVTAHNVIIAQPPPSLPSLRDLSASSGAAADAAMADEDGGAAAAATLGDGAGGAAAADGACWRPQLSLVDFSDAGHGDPLYELVPVLGSCLRCDTAAAASFWKRYRAHVDPRVVWPRRWRRRQPPAEPAQPPLPNGGENVLRLSYCAMCYCLLHEEAELLLQRVWQAEDPTAAAPPSQQQQQQRTLEGLAARLWGFLDEEEEGGEGRKETGTAV